MSSSVPTNIHDRVQAEVDRCINIAYQRYGDRIKSPKIQYKVRGRVAGKAMYSQNIVDFNATLLMENLDDFIGDTVPHEVAHIIDFQVNGIQMSGSKRIHHGRTWKNIMRMLGVDPLRCHSYDVSNSTVRRKAKFDYKCSYCGHILEVGPTVHRKLQRGEHRWHRGCGPNTHIYFVGAMQPTTTKNRHEIKPKRRSKSGSTLEQVRTYMREYFHILNTCPPSTRPMHIAADLGIKKTTATTYYHKLKSEFGL